MENKRKLFLNWRFLLKCFFFLTLYKQQKQKGCVCVYRGHPTKQQTYYYIEQKKNLTKFFSLLQFPFAFFHTIFFFVSFFLRSFSSIYIYTIQYIRTFCNLINKSAKHRIIYCIFWRMQVKKISFQSYNIQYIYKRNNITEF